MLLLWGYFSLQYFETSCGVAKWVSARFWVVVKATSKGGLIGEWCQVWVDLWIVETVLVQTVLHYVVRFRLYTLVKTHTATCDELPHPYQTRYDKDGLRRKHFFCDRGHCGRFIWPRFGNKAFFGGFRELKTGAYTKWATMKNVYSWFSLFML